jgi:hypothetical protein
LAGAKGQANAIAARQCKAMEGWRSSWEAII